MPVLDLPDEYGSDVRPARSVAARKSWAKDPSTPAGQDGTRLDATVVNDLIGLVRETLTQFGIVAAPGDDTAMADAIVAAIQTTPHALSLATDTASYVKMTVAERAKLAALATNYKGSFASLAAVAAAYPAAALGDWAVISLVGEPASIAVWDSDAVPAAWVDVDNAPPQTASTVSFTPAGNIAATNVQTAIQELDTEKAPLASPALTGSPTTPTQNTFSENSWIANTLYADRAGRYMSVRPPGGRLSLSTGAPVPTGSLTGIGTIFYTPYQHRWVPTYDGSTLLMYDVGGELSQALTDATKSPAAAAANSTYDMFLWLDGSTWRCTRGPAWSSATVRGAPADLGRIGGVWFNNAAITNGPAAGRGTYVGTIRTNASALLDVNFGGLAVGGTAGVINLWNTYNRMPWVANPRDSTDSWAYTTATWRQANASAGMQVSYLAGLQEGLIEAAYHALSSTSGTGPRIGVGHDSTAGPSGMPTFGAVNGASMMTTGRYDFIPSLGSHFLAALEQGATGSSFQGDNNSDCQAGFVVKGWY